MNIILGIFAVIGLLSVCFLFACLIVAKRADKIILGRCDECDEEEDGE